jgi:hypothetical protein
LISVHGNSIALALAIAAYISTVHPGAMTGLARRRNFFIHSGVANFVFEARSPMALPATPISAATKQQHHYDDD